MNLLAGATRMPMRGKVHVSEDRFALRFWYGKISDRFCSELPHEWGFAERKNRKVLVLWSEHCHDKGLWHDRLC
jgi:hypothetical protein